MAIQSFQLEIINVYGKRLQSINNPPETIDISDLPTGGYYVIASTTNEKFQRKIIKY